MSQELPPITSGLTGFANFRYNSNYFPGQTGTSLQYIKANFLPSVGIAISTATSTTFSGSIAANSLNAVAGVTGASGFFTSAIIPTLQSTNINAYSLTLSENNIALGNAAGFTGQGSNAVAIGINAGEIDQGAECVAIGDSAGAYYQGASSVCVGQDAGYTGCGAYAICIGDAAGYQYQGANSIILNASGSAVSGTTGSTFQVAPIRGPLTLTNALSYNTTTNEIFYIASSSKYKDNIRDLSVPTDTIYDLIPRQYEFKLGGSDIGYIAEETDIIDHNLTTTSNGEPENINWFRLIVFIVEELKKLKQGNFHTTDLSGCSINESKSENITKLVVEQSISNKETKKLVESLKLIIEQLTLKQEDHINLNNQTTNTITELVSKTNEKDELFKQGYAEILTCIKNHSNAIEEIIEDKIIPNQLEAIENELRALKDDTIIKNILDKLDAIDTLHSTFVKKDILDDIHKVQSDFFIDTGMNLIKHEQNLLSLEESLATHKEDFIKHQNILTECNNNGENFQKDMCRELKILENTSIAINENIGDIEISVEGMESNIKTNTDDIRENNIFVRKLDLKIDAMEIKAKLDNDNIHKIFDTIENDIIRIDEGFTNDIIDLKKSIIDLDTKKSNSLIDVNSKLSIDITELQRRCGEFQRDVHLLDAKLLEVKAQDIKPEARAEITTILGIIDKIRISTEAREATDKFKQDWYDKQISSLQQDIALLKSRV